MVEGPGATRNGRKAQAVVGMVLQDVSFQTKTGLELRKRRLESAFCVGKELFLVFGPVETNVEEQRHDDIDEREHLSRQNCCSDQKPVALRLHFGMNGVLTVRKQTESSKLAPWRRKDESRIRLSFENAFGNDMFVETVASTCVPVSAVVAISKLERLQTRDVCSSIFDPIDVLESLQTKNTKMICDALLDQDRFPGVGNIIKIEGLHGAGVHPRRLVKDMSRDELRSTIDDCRTYAMGWLHSGRAPTKKVYNQTLCKTCKTGRVRMVKMGNDLRRVTFWCESCQPHPSPTSNGMLVDSNTTDRNNSKSLNCQPQTLHRPHPSCPQHGPKRVILRRVRNHASANRNRLFRACAVKGCPYFSWADSHFPNCHCGTMKAILKASKTERTGGRWFLSCANAAFATRTSGSGYGTSKNNNRKECSFFQWATDCQLAPLLKDLSPLT